MAIDLAKTSFLIVDDFSDMRSIIKHMLVSYGTTDIDMVANGEIALHKLAERTYDVILCDYNLGPAKDGQQVLEEAKHNNILPLSTVFIMVTAENTKQMVMGAVEFYPDAYVSKPINKDTLKRRLEKLILKKQDFTEITQLIARDKIASAIEKCDEKIAAQPRNVSEFVKLKTDLCIRLGRYAEVERIFHSALEERELPWARFGLGRIYFLKEEYEQACAEFEKLLDNTPNHMESYDWLAKSQIALEMRDYAMQTLSRAVELSPKVTLRQMSLGNLALEGEDYALAERSFRNATSVGNRSIFNTPANYTKQAQAMTHTKSPKEVFKVLNKIKKDFPRDANANIQGEIAKSLLLKETLPDVARSSIASAQKVYNRNDRKIDNEISLEMAKALFAHGEEEQAGEIMHNVVMNYHDDKKKLNEIKQWMASVGREEQANSMVIAARNLIVKINNEAKEMAESGDLKGAIRMFEDALSKSPDNLTINLNCIRSILKQAEQADGLSPGLNRLKSLFSRVTEIDPGHKDLPGLMERYQLLLGKS